MISKINNPEVLQFIQDHLNNDPSELVLSASKYPHLPIKEIAIQISSRQKAKKKLPEWYANQNVIFPRRKNLEQASSELTAKFKSRWVSGESIADLTGGSGIDLFYMSNNFNYSYYVEPNSDLADITEYNFGLLDRDFEVFKMKAGEFLSSNKREFDVIYLDPSRRDSNKKRVFGIKEYQPNLIELYDQLLMKGKEVVVKTSPMIDIKSTLKLLPTTYKVQVIGVQNEVKEVLFYFKNKVQSKPIIEAWNIFSSIKEDSFKFTFDEEKAAVPKISSPFQFIYEPNSAIRKAGAFSLICSRFSLNKLHPNTHLYTSKEIIDSFPGRVFEIKESFKAQRKEIKKAFPLGRVNVISKNFPMGASEIKKKYSLTDGGDEFLIFCEIPNQKIALRCVLVDTH